MESKSNDIMEKFKALGLGEKIILIAAPLFFIDGFLPWFDYDIEGFGGPSRSGWSGDLSFLSIIAILAAVVMVAQIAVARFTTLKLPALPQGVTWARVHLGLAGYVAFAVVIRLIVGESAGSFDADMAFGIWIAVILAVALAAGGLLMFQQEKQSAA
ncbi:MAG: hypothetical protein HYY03_06150 [Chloroflexi bacterium]|nr:hypothetical protein [Chloroflexota bacterium]